MFSSEEPPCPQIIPDVSLTSVYRIADSSSKLSRNQTRDRWWRWKIFPQLTEKKMKKVILFWWQHWHYKDHHIPAWLNTKCLKHKCNDKINILYTLKTKGKIFPQFPHKFSLEHLNISEHHYQRLWVLQTKTTIHHLIVKQFYDGERLEK